MPTPTMEVGQELTKRFISKWTSDDPGMKKQAEYAVNSYVREKLRENGIARSQILPAMQINNTQIDLDEDPTVIKKFMEIEPDSTATWIPFRGMPNARFVQGKFVPVYFGKIESELHTVNIIELATYKNDLRKILNDQDIKNVQYQEDYALITKMGEIVAANPGEQDKAFFGGLTQVNWAMARQAFPINKPIKFALMNTRTAMEFTKWPMTEAFGFGTYGSEIAVSGKLPTIHGIQIIQSIKSDLLPDGTVYFLAPEDFIGKFFVYQEPTTFIEQKKEWISFSTYEIIGIGIGNTKSFIRCTFNN